MPRGSQSRAPDTCPTDRSSIIILFASTPVTAPILVRTEFSKAGLTESRLIAVLLLRVYLWLFVLRQFSQSLLPKAIGRATNQARFRPDPV